MEKLYITSEQLEKSYSATATFKCRGSPAVLLVVVFILYFLAQSVP